MPIEFFITLKIIHIGSLIFWLGPSLGAWFCLMLLRKQQGELSPATQAVYRVFIKMLIIEHIAFFVLLITGFCMAYLWFGFEQGWLHWKLLLIVGLILPLEMFDIWYGNIKLARLFKRDNVKNYSQSENRMLLVYHRYITTAAIVIIPISVLSIFWLVIAKPNLTVLF